MTVSLVYVTVGNREAALALARPLLEARLIACANILDGMTSLYRWEGKVREDAEVAMIVKTRTELVPEVTARIIAGHEYDCPCVVCWPLTDGNPEFLEWVREQTGPAA